MYPNNLAAVATWLGVSQSFLATAVVILVAWSLIWKGLALWKSARRSSKAWFIILLVVNTVGILEIIYIFLVAKKKQETLSA